MMATQPKLVVMGVSGCGKSRIGSLLAQALAVPFFDADDYHSRANVKKMASGIPLTDDDRAGWLADLATLIGREASGLVLACSALKRAYRERLRADNPALNIVYLRGDFDTIWSRLARREDHYFNGKAMLESQFQSLQEPDPDEGAIVLDVTASPEHLVQQCLAVLAKPGEDAVG